MSISGLPHLAHFLLRSAKFHQTHLVGRLKLLEKLVEMHCETVAKLKASGSSGVDSLSSAMSNKRISYRHLCSSLIFARRHVYPPEQPVFPHNLLNEGAMAPQFRRAPGGGGGEGGSPGHPRKNSAPTSIGGGGREQQQLAAGTGSGAVEGVQVSSFACLMEANIKASRLVSLTPLYHIHRPFYIFFKLRIATGL